MVVALGFCFFEGGPIFISAFISADCFLQIFTKFYDVALFSLDLVHPQIPLLFHTLLGHQIRLLLYE